MDVQGPSDKSRARANAAALAAAATGASEPVGSSTASAKKRGLKRKATESPPNGVKEKGKKKDEDSADVMLWQYLVHVSAALSDMPCSKKTRPTHRLQAITITAAHCTMR